MAIEQTIGGAYVGTYNSVNTGFTKQGYELQFNVHADLVNESDLYGGSLLDFLMRGGSHTMIFTSKVYKAGSVTPFWPWGTLGVIGTTAAPIGRLASNVAAAMVLTAVASTPAATLPATLTASKSILAPESNLSLLYDNRVRECPVKLACLPSESGGTITAFTST